MTRKRQAAEPKPIRYCHIAPFGRDCFNCGRWLTNEDDLVREDKRPEYDQDFKPIRIRTYMVYRCPDCGHLMRNERVTIYD